MNGISWSRIVGAAARRLVAMPGEMAGYLALGALDAMGDRPGRLIAEDIRLTDGGRVALLRVMPSDAAASDRCLRELLRQLLDVSSSPSAALLRVASSSATGVGATFATELQTALIPVNRAAARRALSRLHRELLRLPPSVGGAQDSIVQVEKKARALGTCGDDETESRATSAVEELERDVPAVASIEQSERSAAEPIEVAPQVPDASIRLPEIPDLELPVSLGLPPDIAGDSNVESAGTAASPAVRETTLMLAPVAPVPRLEQTQPLNIKASSMHYGRASAEQIVTTEEPFALEPTMALPLLRLRHRVRDHQIDKIVADECVEIVPDERVECWSREALVLAESEGRAEVAELASDERETREHTDVQANVVESSWDATSMDSVVEVSDEEIIYEQAADQATWLDIDCSDESLFEAVAPRVVVLDPAAAFVGRTISGELEEIPVVEHVASTLASAEASDGSNDDDAWEVDDGDRLVVDGSKPTTLYRDRSLGDDGPRSTVEGLSQQFASEPAWSEDELCRNLRFVAGFEPSPCAPSVCTHTPPPTVETILKQNPEQAEPTRRLRRVGSMVAVVLLVGAGAYGVRSAEGRVASTSQFSVDALRQICRATVTVAGVDARQHLRIRQVGDPQLRAPSSVSNAAASFVGLRCGQDAELFVQELPAAGLRRIPISGDRLTPRDSHPWASVVFHLEGQGVGG